LKIGVMKIQHVEKNYRMKIVSAISCQTLVSDAAQNKLQCLSFQVLPVKCFP